jgi:hypothetical protein
MKNIYECSFELKIALDSFVRMTGTSNDELLVFSHYVDEVLTLRSGHYLYEKHTSSMTALERKNIREGGEKRGIVFMPDIKNIISNIKVKSLTNNSITITCDLYLNKKDEVVEFALCEDIKQEYITISPIEYDQRKTSSISGDRKYYIDFKQLTDVDIYTPFKF